MISPGSAEPVTRSQTKGKPDTRVIGIIPLSVGFLLYASAKYWKRTMPSSTSKLVCLWRRRGQKGSSRPANPNSRFTPVKHSTPPSRVSGLTQTPIPSNDPATSEFHAAHGLEQPTASIDNSGLPARKCTGTQTCTNPTDILTTQKSDSDLGPKTLFDDAGTESDSEDGLKKWFEDGGLENSKFVSQISHFRGFSR